MLDATETCLYTIGHSNQPFEAFLALLERHAIDVLADVRSRPYSQYASQFNYEDLQRGLAGRPCQYVFQGAELGGRPDGREFYDAAGHVLYSKVAQSPRFLAGVTWIEHELPRHRVAVMCSEEDPAVCHRHLLIARVMAERGVAVRHIRGDGRLQTYDQVVKATGGDAGQKLLFAELADAAWKSPKPVLPASRQDDPRRRGAAAHPTPN
ncbi:MAG: DUF488 domain-containing protein [Planctomycetia bacterium]|nr:DUF488 domain-containing protein [Planctomycetia bacterium]